MSDTRLLFFDLDGTLLDDRTHTLPSSTAPALVRARENGCMLFLNSGRTYCNLDPVVDTLPFDGMVLGCGTRIHLHGTVLKALEYTHDDSLAIRDIFIRHDIPVVFECDTAIYFEPVFLHNSGIQDFRSFSERAGISRDIQDNDPEFRAVKMFCFAPFIRVRAILEDLTAAGFPYTAIDRGRESWELVPSGCSKAEGIETVRKALGVPLSNCYAFGDSNNDLPMLLHVPHSVCVGNAPEEVRKQCSYVTDRVEDDGIANALNALGLLGS